LIKNHLKRLLILLILMPAIFLQGCFPQPAASVEPEPIPHEEYEGEMLYTPPVISPPQPGRFTLRYDPGSSLNPITTLTRENIVVSSLLHETLFSLDGNLMPHPVLVSEWSTEDNILFEFELLPNINMSDGGRMTAQDAVYSLRQAMVRGRFVNRLGSILRVESTGDLTFLIELRNSNSRFTHLLDIPVIRSGSSGSNLPPGTGPFRFSYEGAMNLVAFQGHRDYENLPIYIIHLRECADTQLTELFDTGELSLLWDDPHDAFEIRLNRLRETRYFETSIIQFLGFNTRHIALRDADVRRAISELIDRQYIVENIKRPGLTLASPMALSPAFHLYDTQWEYRRFPAQMIAGELLDRAGLYDYNSDMFLEVGDGFGNYTPFTIDFIVNIENSHKVSAAHQIAGTLRRNGLNVVVRELPWDRFIQALNSGNFDMYYGEIQLGADFDLSPLLLAGPLNFGYTANSHFIPFIADFLRAETDSEIRWAAGRLLNEITLNAPFAPILYKRHAIYSPIGAITGANPSQTSVFHNLTDWSINLMMLN